MGTETYNEITQNGYSNFGPYDCPNNGVHSTLRENYLSPQRNYVISILMQTGG